MADLNYNPAARRLAIQHELARRQTVSVEYLARILNVSEATIRRDLNALDTQSSMIRRTHGGAVIKAPSNAQQDFSLREQLNPEAKRAIAQSAVDMIDAGGTLFLNDGSTVMAVAREILARGLELMVVTTSLNVASLMSESSDVDVVLIGGRLRHRTLSTTGDLAVESLRSINGDTAFLSAEAFHPKDGMMMTYETDAALARTMSKRADKTIVGAISQKLNKRDRFTALQMSEVDAMVTDSGDPKVIKAFEDSGVSVTTAISSESSNTPRSKEDDEDRP